jgi:probable HAF family extracellular repeat protein
MMYSIHSFKMCSCCVFVAGAAMSLAYGTQTIAAPSFQGLGDLPGGGVTSGASGVSADGSVVVGSSASASGTEAFRWTQAGGMVGLGDLPGGDFNSSALGVSADGSVIVGGSLSDSGLEAFMWTESSGLNPLGDLAGGAFASSATSVSADGTVIAGWGTIGPSTTTDRSAFRWTEADGMGDMGIDLESHGQTYVSRDGQAVIGTLRDDPVLHEAFVWSSSEGITRLGDIWAGPHPTSSRAFSISADGSTIVGGSRSDVPSEAFKWTASEGMVGLGQLPGFSDIGEAFAASANGTTIVGQSININSLERRAFTWDESNGIRELQTVLSSLGLNLTGWTLTEATGISDDGLTIVGTGINPNGDHEAFIATLPEPGAVVLMTLGATAWLSRRG